MENNNDDEFIDCGSQQTSYNNGKNYNDHGYNSGANDDIGDNIRKFIQDTINSIDGNAIGENINRAVNQGIGRIREQIERGVNSTNYRNNNFRYENRQYGNQNNGGAQYTGWQYGSRQNGGTQYNNAQQRNSGYYGQPYTNYQSNQNKRSKRRAIDMYPAEIVSHSPAGRISGALWQIFGGIGLTGGIITSVVFGCIWLYGGNELSTVGTVGTTISLFAVCLNSGFLKIGGSLRKRVKRFYNYVKIFNGKRYCDVKTIEEKTGKSSKFIIKDVKKMINKGMFPQACFDDEEKTIILDHEVYDEYIDMKKQRAEVEREKEEAKKAKDTSKMTTEEKLIEEGRLYLKQIKEANDAIPGEDISKKLERLEAITSKIFEYVGKHPEKVGEIRKFMDYYMPTTLKLVYAYKEFDAQDIEGENIKAAKKEIEQSLDMVNKAFENLFDSMFQDEAMDISSDISVLKTMLKQEGLMGSDFRKEKDDE